MLMSPCLLFLNWHWPELFSHLESGYGYPSVCTCLQNKKHELNRRLIPCLSRKSCFPRVSNSFLFLAKHRCGVPALPAWHRLSSPPACRSAEPRGSLKNRQVLCPTWLFRCHVNHRLSVEIIWNINKEQQNWMESSLQKMNRYVILCSTVLLQYITWPQTWPRLTPLSRGCEGIRPGVTEGLLWLGRWHKHRWYC